MLGQWVQPSPRLQAMPGHMVVKGALWQMFLPTAAVGSTERKGGGTRSAGGEDTAITSAGGKRAVAKGRQAGVPARCRGSQGPSAAVTSAHLALTWLAGGGDLRFLAGGAVVRTNWAALFVWVIEVLIKPVEAAGGRPGGWCDWQHACPFGSSFPSLLQARVLNVQLQRNHSCNATPRTALTLRAGRL